jgi:N-acetyl-anhydromuramyl-L-alanine amidase AmpD
MEYRGIRYTLRAGIERGQWVVVVYPQGVETKANKVFGTREEAELQAHYMINRRLDPKSCQRARPKR